MDKSTDTHSVPAVRTRRRPLKSVWQTIRKPLARSAVAKRILVEILAFVVRFIGWTNPLTKESGEPIEDFKRYEPAILALWHGQHLIVPVFARKGVDMVGLFSRSADAEINAQVAARLGLGVVRGSGGRDRGRAVEKGGARALVSLKRVLNSGKSVAMIADIPHGTPRDSGMGIVMLAKISGRPIVPAAFATSRRKVLENTWDKTTINLPFGRMAVTHGEPIYVDADADAEEMERKRQELTDVMNAVTAEAYRQLDQRK